MSVLTAAEQLGLELMNRARLDPAGEAKRLGISLNEGLAAGTISTAAKDPFASNAPLHDVARAHSQHMIDVDLFGHDGIGDGNPFSRMSNAGYNFFAAGENIAFNGTSGSVNETAFAIKNYEDLFVDSGIPGRGHRTNMLGDFKEVGIGEVVGVFTQNGNNFNSLMLTQDFGTVGAGFFVTGVAINDLDKDSFYDIGEGRGGVSVSVSQGGVPVSADTTASAGGYAVATSGGTLDVTFQGGGLAAPVTVTVQGGGHSVKADMLDANKVLSSATTTLGSGAKDLGLLGVADINGTGNALANKMSGGSGRNVLSGLGGNDTLAGGLGRDTLTGGANKDVFDFNSVLESGKTANTRDVITDFKHLIDDIDIRTIDSNSTVAGNQNFSFIGTAAFHHVAGEVRFFKQNLAGTANDKTVVAGDINGDGAADFQIQLKGLISLTKADFIL